MTPTEPVKLTVKNRSSRPIDLVLEPLGEIYPLSPGQSRDVQYVAGSESKLTIEHTEAEVKIWDESAGTLEIGSA